MVRPGVLAGVVGNEIITNFNHHMFQSARRFVEIGCMHDAVFRAIGFVQPRLFCGESFDQEIGKPIVAVKQKTHIKIPQLAMIDGCERMHRDNHGDAFIGSTLVEIVFNGAMERAVNFLGAGETR